MRLDAVIKSLSVANAAIKNTASTIEKEGWYPTFSASGQDVWLPDYRFDQRGIVVSAVGARCGKAFKADGRWNVCANTHALSVDESVADRDYCWYMLNNEKWWIKGGTAQPFVKVKDSLKREHVFPTLSDQKKIVKQLDQICHVIELRQQQITALDDLIKARFVEMFGDMLINPKGLPEQRLDSLADIVSGITKGRKVKTDELYEVPYMAVSNVKDGYIDWTTVKTIMATAAEIDQYRLMSGDVLMTEGGDPDKLGRGAIIHEPPKDCIHQNHIFRVRLKQDILLSVFMAQYLQQQKAKRYFLGCAKQTTGIASINMRQLSALPVLVPPMKEQEEYAAFVAQIDKSKVVVQKALNEAQLLFDSLMQQYFG